MGVGGYFRVAQTYITVRQCFFWLGMLNVVQIYTEGSDKCTQVSFRAEGVVGFLQPLPVAHSRWEDMGVNVIPDI